MSSTITLSALCNFALPILNMQPLTVTNMEPALTAANIVLETVLSPPFRWRQNRGGFNFTCVPKVGVTPAQADYPLVLPDFGWLEDQWVTDPTSGEVYPLTGKISLAMPTGLYYVRPQEIAAQGDDNNGTITFRVKTLPDKAYTISGNYQKKAVPLVSVASQFGPIPDEMAHVLDWGFLTVMALLVKNAEFPRFEQYFISRLLSLQDGLDEVSRNIFIGNFAEMMATLQRSQGKAQQAIGARQL
jgi:hypothetical protein